jgi:hypothetical protein
MAVNNELEKMWKEAIMPRFKVLSRHFSGGTEENCEHLFHESGPDRDSNRELPIYKPEV